MSKNKFAASFLGTLVGAGVKYANLSKNFDPGNIGIRYSCRNTQAKRRKLERRGYR